MADTKESAPEFVPGEAADTVVSLAQVILAPLDAIFKAQVHAARSFLNFVLQLSYPHKEETPAGPGPATAPPAKPGEPDTIYSVDFVQEAPQPPTEPNASPAPRRLQRVSVPALALVPLRPLSISEANFDLAMEITWIAPHDQTRQKERDKLTPEQRNSPTGENRPWYLVDDPISLRGHISPMPPAEGQADQPHIKINVKLGPVPTPSGLEKLLTTLTQSASVADAGPAKK